MNSKVNIGDVFHRWEVLDEGEYFYEHLKTRTKRCKGWLCRCKCGTIRNVKQASLLSKTSKSCGCILKEIQAEKKSTSGKDIQTRTRKIHNHMLRRCNLESVKEYAFYGGRGISVCARWSLPEREGFFNFLEDMGVAPDGMQLDRIDPDGNYCPENCRWVDLSVQSYNRRKLKSNTSGRTGVIWNQNANKWDASITKDNVTFRLYYGDSYDEAVLAREEAEIILYGELKPEVRS